MLCHFSNGMLLAVGTWKYLEAKAVDLPSDRLLRIGYSVFVEPNSKDIVFADGVFIAIILLNHATLVWGLPRDRVHAPRLCQIPASRMVQVETLAWKSNLRWMRAWNKGAERNMICLPTSQSQKNHHTALWGNWSPERFDCYIFVSKTWWNLLISSACVSLVQDQTMSWSAIVCKLL